MATVLYGHLTGAPITAISKCHGAPTLPRWSPLMTVAELVDLGIAFDNSYARLPDRFSVRLAPAPVAAPRLVRINESLARLLAIDPEALAMEQGIEFLSGNRIAGGSEPLAM